VTRRYLFLLLAPLVPLSQARLDCSFGRFRTEREVSYRWSPGEVRTLSRGFEDLMADLYWLRTVQYYGREKLESDKGFELLLPLTNITTTLDPRFEIAYRYGAIFLAERPPHGAGDPEAAIRLLEKGIAWSPHSWRLLWDLGALQFFTLKDARKAAATLLEASKVQGAPYWLETLAGSMLIQGGEHQTARLIWSRMYEQTEGAMKANALQQLRRIDALEVAGKLEELARTFEARTGRKPGTLDELRQAGLLRIVPSDPTGVPFDYDPRTGAVTISGLSSLWTRPLAGS
jgi:hypothetical protein